MPKNNKPRVMPPRKHPEEPHWESGKYVPCPLSRPDRLMGRCKFASEYAGEVTCHQAWTDALGVNVKRLQMCPMRERAYAALAKKKEMQRMVEAQRRLVEDLEGDHPFG